MWIYSRRGPRRCRGAASPAAGDVPHPGRPCRRRPARLRHDPGRGREHRRRAEAQRGHALPLDPADARAGTDRRGPRRPAPSSTTSAGGLPITAFGTSVARAEARRLAQLVKLARVPSPQEGLMRLYRLLLHSSRRRSGPSTEEMAAIRPAPTRCRRLSVAARALGGALGDVSSMPCALHDILRQDVRFTARTLARTPASRHRGARLRPRRGGDVATFSITDTSSGHSRSRAAAARQAVGWGRVRALSPANYRDWKRMATSFGGDGRVPTALGEPRRGQRSRAAGRSGEPRTSSRCWRAAARGRMFTDADDRDGAPGRWSWPACGRALRRRSDHGTGVVLDNAPCTIIRVMPAASTSDPRQLWTATRFGAKISRTGRTTTSTASTARAALEQPARTCRS